MGAAGATVAVNYRAHAEAADRIVSEIEDAGGAACAVRADVSREDQVEAMFAEIVERLGTIDILVNNAGIQKDGPFHEMALDDWRAVIEVNLTGQFLCARAAVGEFLRRGIRPDVSKAAGKIICISSVHEAIPWACRVNYAASKGGVGMMMKSLAQEVAGQRIRVNSIAPGAIRTEINREAWQTPEAEAELLKLVPYGRIGEVEDVARAAVWLASDEADYITGTTLYVDGGMMLYPGFLGHG
jgi:glucose 1-dehydrogenase